MRVAYARIPGTRRAEPIVQILVAVGIADEPRSKGTLVFPGGARVA